MYSAEEIRKITNEAISVNKNKPYTDTINQIEVAILNAAEKGEDYIDVKDYCPNIWLLSKEHLEQLITVLTSNHYRLTYKENYYFYINW